METVSSKNAPDAIGPYSQAVKSGNLVFTAGQIPVDPVSGKVVSGDISVQTEQVIKNLMHVLEAAGTSLDKAVKVSVFLKDMNDFQKMNDVYALHFRNRPARSTIQAARLPKDALVEIDCVCEL